MIYQNLQQPDTIWKKIQRNAYLIVTITLLTHTMSITYSMMSFKQQSGGFISIVVSSLVCYFLSNSHLTIYGISILGIMYLKMLEPYYQRSQLHYIVALSGVMIFPFKRIIKFISKIFQSFPGKIHGSMLFGTALITLVKFFPLSIENIETFFASANSSALTNPWNMIVLTFHQFNFLTLVLTVLCISCLYLLRNKIVKIPFIALVVLIGILINYKKYFDDYQDLCNYPKVDCKFYIVKLQNMIPPQFQKIFLLVPSAGVMTIIVIYEQFLYLQEFQRRGKRSFGQGNLGQTQNQLKVISIGNIISGLLGGLPICINLFATYQNFSFNIQSGNKGSKIVGLMQIPVSYAFYSILRWLYQMIPLFILFVIIATPAVYFLSNMFKIHHNHILYITGLAALNVVTHPIIALILASFISIHDISLLLKDVPAQILLQDVNPEGQRRSSTIVHTVNRKQSNLTSLNISQFQKRIIVIDTDQPSQFEYQSYILYRFTGAVSYLNYFEHKRQINTITQKYIKTQNVPLLLSFRYSQIIDEQSLYQLAIYVQKLQKQNNIRIVFTGLHNKIIKQMEKIKYFQHMLKKDQKCMFRLDNPS